MRTSKFKTARPKNLEAGNASQAIFFPALKSEVIWRLPFLYILYVVILGLLFFSQERRDPFHVLIPLIGTLLLLSMQFMLSRGANTKRLYDLLYLICGMTAVLPAGMLFSQDFSPPLLSLVFLAQLACWIIFPWNFLRSMSWAILLLMYWSIIIFTQGFSLALMLAVIPILVLAVITSRTNYQGWNLIQSSILLSKLGGEIQDTKNFVIVYSHILLHALDSRHAVLLKESGEITVVGQSSVHKPQLNVLTAKSLYTTIKDQRKKSGHWKTKDDISLKAFFFDCFGRHYNSFNFSFVAILHDKIESEAVLLLPVEHFVDRVGFYRFSKTLQGLNDIYNLSLMTQRNQVMSNDTVSIYGKELAELESEVNQIVHLVNNNAQEIAISCEVLKEKASYLAKDSESELQEFADQISQVESSLRALTQSVSDVKLLREISSLRSFSRREQVSTLEIIEDCRRFLERASASKNLSFLLETENFNDLDGISVPSAEYLKAILRALGKAAVKRVERRGSLKFCVRREDALIMFEIADDSSNIIDTTTEDTNMKVAYLFAGLSNGKLEVRALGTDYANSVRLFLPVCRIEKKVYRSNSSWILLVDDNPQVVGFYAHIAEALGMRYETADSYQASLDIINNQGRPKLVITDIQLSRSSGLDLVADLRERFGQDLPIIVVSGNDEQEIADKVYSCGASKYLKKPLGRKKLFSEIESLLK